MKMTMGHDAKNVVSRKKAFQDKSKPADIRISNILAAKGIYYIVIYIFIPFILFKI